MKSLVLCCAIGLAAVLGMPAAWAMDQTAGPSQTTHRLLVRLHESPNVGRSAPPSGAPVARQDRTAERLQALMARLAIQGTPKHRLGDGAWVLRLDQPRSLREAEQLARVLASQPEVADVGVDLWVRPQAFIPNDPHFFEQWALLPRDARVAGSAHLSDAWNVPGAAFTGSPSVIVAVIDTGWVPHPDLDGAVLDGYDFVSSGSIDGQDVAGDGDGRDGDPSDPGDYCVPRGEASSWHGLKMTSLIAATIHNGRGIAGAAPGVRVQHIRALGRCGGWLSDVTDALRWAVGDSLSGVPDNPSAAQVRVVSLSLGSAPGLDCSSGAYRYVREAVDRARAAGVLVVAAAGNESSESVSLPAGCPGVLAVGAHTSQGDLADYSNRSPRLSLTAPGGGCGAGPGALCDPVLILTLGNDGERAPGRPMDRDQTGGTSAATPLVAATAALMFSMNEALTADQVRTILTETARAHPEGSYCAIHPGMCGAGMLDAEAAVRRVRDGPWPGFERGGGGGALSWVWTLALIAVAGWAQRLRVAGCAPAAGSSGSSGGCRS